MPLPLAVEFSMWPFVALFAIGFIVGAFGHLISSRPTIAAGIVLVFLATVLGPLIVYGNPY